MSILRLVMHVLCVFALKVLSGFFWEKDLAFFGENRLATLAKGQNLRKLWLCATRRSVALYLSLSTPSYLAASLVHDGIVFGSYPS